MTTPTVAHKLFSATVARAETLNAHLSRLTFHANEFREHQLTGPDEFFGLLMPKPGHEFTAFNWEGSNIRAAVAALPEAQRPELRWYTIRQHRPEQGEIDVDIVTHGDEGPGSSWVLQAQAEDSVGIFTCAALWQANANDQLLIADATAIPALQHILEYLQTHAPERLATTNVIAVAPSASTYEHTLHDWSQRVARFHFLQSTPEGQPEDVIAVLDSWFNGAAKLPDYVWVSGERALTKQIRKYATQDWNLSPEQVTFVPYWILGQARP